MSTLAIAPLQSNFHTPHIIHSALISLLISLHVITQFELSPTQLYRTHYLLFPPLSASAPLSYRQLHFLIYGPYIIIPIDSHFYDSITFRPYLIFVQLLPVLLANMTRIISIFASYLFHSYIISTPFQLFAICAILITLCLAPIDFHSTPISFPPTI